jgi:hypothetical protein
MQATIDELRQFDTELRNDYEELRIKRTDEYDNLVE